MTDLRIPYGLSDGEMVPVDRVQKDKEYRCPDCKGRLVFRAGNKKRPHFAHYRIPNHCNFMNESWVHFSAKHLIYLHITEWINGHRCAPILKRVCSVCNDQHEQPLPPKVKKAHIEYRIQTDKGTCVADIGLLDDQNQLLCAIEVVHTHEVNEHKEDKFDSIPWVEVKAKDIFESPDSWSPVREKNLKRWKCRCVGAKRMKIIQRGLASHVDYCPIRARVWKGKPYANMIDDCWTCSNFVAVEYGPDPNMDYSGTNYVLCKGHQS